ncbi:FHA-domain-containing protein [Mycobacterium tuberculosis]|nr:FHA-domain-containing protein [Mycobacterium tuberculosis]
MTIGRSSESALVIRDDYTSSHHARLLLRGDTWAIQDLDSTNGTFVAGQRVTGGPVSLRLGTPVKVGATTFELRA